MIPINLKIQGFLTFKSQAEINFQDVNEDGIFLISGPTGSGKTSLFDAISYALYGVAPTSGRNSAKELRSHLIGPDEETSVEFTFRAGPHEYEVRRWQKGQTSKQRLVVDGNEKEALTKVGEIQTVIGDALGLTAAQFCKIVMLPQGEFRNFLVASSKDKSEILRKLFDTDHYARIRLLIGDKLKNIYAKYSQAETIINSEKCVSEAAQRLVQPQEIIEIIDGELKAVRVQTSDLKEKLRQARLILDNLNLRLEAADKLNRDLAEKDSLEGILEDALALEATFQADLDKAGQLNQVRPLSVFNQARVANLVNLKRKETSLADTGKALAIAEAELTTAAHAQDKNPERRERLTVISKETDRLAEVLGGLTELAKARDKERQETGILGDLRRKIFERDRLTQKRETLFELNQSYSKAELELSVDASSLRERFSLLNQTMRAVKSYQDMKSARTKKILALETGQAELIELQVLEEKQKAVAESLKEQFDKQGLAQFTHLIIDGEPCPLCGALEHPMPFTSELIISNQELKAAETAWRDSEKRVYDKKSSLSYLAKEIEEAKAVLMLSETELDEKDRAVDIAIFERQLRTIEDQGREKTRALADLKLRQEELKRDRNQTEQGLDQLKDIQVEYDRHKDELTRIQQTIANLEAKTLDQDEDGLRQQLGLLNHEKDQTEALIAQTEADYRSISSRVTELKTTRLKTEEDIRELTEEVKKQEIHFAQELARLDLALAEFQELEKELPAENEMRKNAQEFFKTLDQTKTRVEMMRGKLEGKSPVDLEGLEKELRDTQESVEEITGTHELMIRRESKLENALEKIRAAANLYEKYKKELDIARKLDGTTGKGTTFENYVLGYYLDGVLVNANVRLKNMTNGRFTLIRQTIDTDGRRSIEGLDINVYDTYSNSERDVKTLSGGESFKASLAMALGLSDFIQENKSGIRLDTIFIDEGFGTLDQESLDSAMETILEIQDMGRLVGIISHVEELKERIPTQIVVENRGAEGSFIKISKR